jgi:hypothetical protein
MKGLFYRISIRTGMAISVLAISLNSIGQEYTEEDLSSDPDYIGSFLNEKSDPNTLKTPEIKKVSFYISTGMMLGTAGNKANFAASYLAPSLSYNVSPRFRIRVGGLLFFNSFYNPAISSSLSEESSSRLTDNLALFVAADYFLSDRITVTGSLYRLPEYSIFGSGMAPQVYNRNNAYYRMPSESMSLGLNYKIFPGLSIGAEFRFSNDNSYYLYTPAFMPGTGLYDPAYYW